MRMLVRFGKKSRLRFISHLDLQRFLHMALNRTGLPVLYSQGFNPHPLMAFGSALALGWTSEYEVLDVKLAAPMGRKRCEEALRFALPEDMPVYEVKLVGDRCPAAMAQVRASDYEIRLTGADAQRAMDFIPEFLAMDEIYAMKKTKSGEREINIRPLILNLRAENGAIHARLMLTERDSLKADLLARTLCARAGAQDVEIRVHRTCLLAQNAEGELVPLMEVLA